MSSAAVLIVAKAPVPGLAKTRLAGEFGDVGAATLAAAALLDTVRTARGVAGASVIVALTGRLADAVRSVDLIEALSGCTLITQRGDGFAQRLVNAHLDAADTGAQRVIQIGMDTPQVRADQLRSALRRLEPRARRCVLGIADDGGWWAFGTALGRGARALSTVTMSRPDTGIATQAALRHAGLTVALLDPMTDVDLPTDIAEVARECPDTSEFARTAELLGAVR
ncbi:DUF2064 domain-containing protein [Gordonia sp. Z-3]|jgi:glycosyltransferase A (GT-A) superfamily protein (DUF2064 family)|uniref:DUF2064 domain-containing protein n=2 Tax=Gordonia TaxID=2053 RepID=A0A9X3I7M5_9ACTN|nr:MULTISPECIES: DUF2064 domain-containing protein [Gordonia]MAU82406.1 hypothetical protein [Gordonia sp. (in: high G+C Gram-positive bacteria)]MCF3939590.1 DUF2064 domain-containing protein [Gordonia tangerina]MCX2966734.1 DUF2064 domain-containing protein [Gordonia aquimaris]MED5802725.1 DUF2064 domain-containing protein [Gordonia sp. Z-3]